MQPPASSSFSSAAVVKVKQNTIERRPEHLRLRSGQTSSVTDAHSFRRVPIQRLGRPEAPETQSGIQHQRMSDPTGRTEGLLVRQDRLLDLTGIDGIAVGRDRTVFSTSLAGRVASSASVPMWGSAMNAFNSKYTRLNDNSSSRKR